MLAGTRCLDPAMLIVCPHCSTNYEVGSSALGDAGRTVRCARCQQTWFATATPEPAVAMAAAGAVATGAVAPAVEAKPAEPAAPARMAAPAVPDEPDPPPMRRKSADVRADNGRPEGDELWGIPDFAAPPLAPEAPTAPQETAEVPVPETVDAVADPLPAHDIESLAARRAGGTKRKPKQFAGRLTIPIVPAIIAVELAAIIAIVAWRSEIVRTMPQTASLFRAIGMPVNLRGLAFTDVHISADPHDGTPVLLVEGNIENTTRAAVGVPRLRFALRNSAQVELISWNAQPDQGSLAPGEALPFHSRLASPPADGHDVVVRFLTRHDLEDGMR